MGEPGFWDDQERAAKVSAEHSRTQRKLDGYRKLEQDVDDLEALEEMASEDDSIAGELQEQYTSVRERLADLEMERLFSGDYDAGDAIVTVNSGAGGTDSQDWAEMLLRMLLRYAEQRGFKVEMVEASDSLIGYRTYPHVDRFETGQHAARALSLLLARGRPPGRALRKLPFLIPLNDQCTLVEPSRSVVARSVVAEGELVNLSYLAGFPPSDLYWCGPAVIAHGWSQQAADAAADALAREIALKEPEFAVPMVSPEEGVREAMALARSAARPVVLCDTQDNPGCGSSAASSIRRTCRSTCRARCSRRTRCSRRSARA